MTTIDERLEEILVRRFQFGVNIGRGQGDLEPTYSTDEVLDMPSARAAIRTLFLDLIAEAKPEGYDDYYASNPVEKGKKMGYNEAIDEFENNLKQELDEFQGKFL